MPNIAYAKMKFATPTPFSGDKKKFEHFREHCENDLTLTDPMAIEDENIFWTITYLDRAAVAFVKPFVALNWENHSFMPWHHNWTNFWEELENALET